MTEPLFDPSPWVETQPSKPSELVYFLHDPGRLPPHVRLGYSGEFDERLSTHLSSNHHMEVFGTIIGGDRKLEDGLHDYLEPFRVPKTRSWYELTPEIVDIAKEGWLPEYLFKEWQARLHEREVVHELWKTHGDNGGMWGIDAHIGQLLRERQPEDYASLVKAAQALVQKNFSKVVKWTEEIVEWDRQNPYTPPHRRELAVVLLGNDDETSDDLDAVVQTMCAFLDQVAPLLEEWYGASVGIRAEDGTLLLRDPSVSYLDHCRKRLVEVGEAPLL